MNAMEAVKYVDEAVRYQCSCTGYAFLKQMHSMEDLIQEVYVTLLSRNAFEKYNGSTTPYYYIRCCVLRCLSDMVSSITCRSKYFDTETVVDETAYEHVSVSPTAQWDGTIDAESILKSLKKVKSGSIKGTSPLLGKCSLNFYTLALHLRDGYSIADIAQIFNVTDMVIYRLRVSLRDYLKRTLSKEYVAYFA